MEPPVREWVHFATIMIPTAFSTTDARALAAFLEGSARPQGTLRYHQLQGFLFGVVCSPELIPPSDWLSVIFDDEDAVYADMDEEQAVLGLIMSLYNAVNEEVLTERCGLPADCAFRDDVLENMEENAPVSQWSQGFMAAYHWLENVWDEHVPESQDGDLGAMLMALSVFASREFADDFVREGEPTDDAGHRMSVTDYAQMAREVFPDAMSDFAELGRSLYQGSQRAEEERRTPAKSTKVGRNAPCPCGSGRKFKNCCGSSKH